MLAKRCYLCLAKNVIKLSKLNTLFIIFILILCAFKWGFCWLFVSFLGWCFGSCCYRSCFFDCLFVCMHFCIALGRCFFVFFLILSLFFVVVVGGLIVSVFHHLLWVFSHKFASVLILLPETMTTLYHANSFTQNMY